VRRRQGVVCASLTGLALDCLALRCAAVPCPVLRPATKVRCAVLAKEPVGRFVIAHGYEFAYVMALSTCQSRRAGSGLQHVGRVGVSSGAMIRRGGPESSPVQGVVDEWK